MNSSIKMGVAAAALGLGSLTANAATITVALTLTVTPNGGNTGGTFKVFEQNVASSGSPSSLTSGLGGLSFDVNGTGNVSVTAATQKFPSGFDDDSLGADGFDSPFKSNGTAGKNIQNAQSTLYTSNSAGDVNSIFLGVGNMAETVQAGDDGSGDGGAGDAPGNLNDPVTIALPVLIATGVYTGSSGSLTVTSDPSRATLLPLPMPAASAAGTPVSTFSPDFVTGQTVQIGVPEPASLGLLATAFGGLMRRRRK